MGVFGRRDLWSDSWASKGHQANDAPDNIDRSEFSRELRSSCKLAIEKEVDLESLSNYAGLGIGRRQAILREYLRTCQSEGRIEENIRDIYKQYSPRSTIGPDMGRWYSSGGHQCRAWRARPGKRRAGVRY